MRTVLWGAGVAEEADRRLRRSATVLRRGVTKVTRKRTAGDIQEVFSYNETNFQTRGGGLA